VELEKKKTGSLWFSIIFDFHKTKTLKRLSISVLVVGMYTGLLIFLERQVLHVDFKPPSTIYSLLGIVLGLLLVFRTNTAYDRWWEGRKLLSTLGTNAKNLSIKLNAILPKTDIVNRLFFAKMIANHAFAMKENLRDGVIFEELQETDPEMMATLKESYHIPNQITAMLAERIFLLYREGKIKDPELLDLAKYTDVATEVVSGCERIRTTPVPFSYAIHLKKFIFFFTMILPFGFIHDLGYWAILVIMLIFYALVGLEAIGEEIEDPFGQDENDLPIDFICKQTQKSVNAILISKI
jgi:ion channel-forming bestrophin family protein